MLLVILDLNGTLLESTHKRLRTPHDAKARSKFVYFRPGMHAFLHQLLQMPNVRVGVWSSNVAANTRALVEIAFGAAASQLLFVKAREDCVVFPDYSSEKHVQTVFDETGFTPANTVFIDDSLDKVHHPERATFHYHIPEFVPGNETSDVVLRQALTHINQRAHRV